MKIISLRVLSVFLLMSCWPVVAEEKIEISVVASRTHSLFYMIESLLDVPHRSPQMATNFSGRVGNWDPVAVALDDWKESLSSAELSLLRFPGSHDRTQTLGQVLERVALQSQDAEDFGRRVRPWLGPKAGSRLKALMTVVEPLYEQYWWPGPELGGRVAELESDLDRGEFQENFQKAMSFYAGRLGSDKATVALVPYRKDIGEDKVHTRGHNSGELQVFEVVLERSQDGMAGVCFHEFLHGLWDGQDEAEAQRWREKFESRGLWGRLAYAQLNEGLATALGNGWFQAKLDGELSAEDWYADPVINSFGKALLPIVENAVEEARPPSDEELDAMVRAFQAVLPDADSTFDVVAAQFLTVSSRPEAHLSTYQSELMRLGPVRSSRVSDWSSESSRSQTFVLYWPGSPAEALDWTVGEAPYSLRRTDQGWELYFTGGQKELFELLREFQNRGLKATI